MEGVEICQDLSKLSTSGHVGILTSQGLDLTISGYLDPEGLNLSRSVVFARGLALVVLRLSLVAVYAACPQ